ncbi:MAG TPA: MFS transporter, partial [Gemmataceae bacterium]|nr:MFS transporter [Gemmataceae bacterium]
MAVAASVPSTRLPVLCLAAGLWAFSFGACAELASVWLKRAGYDYTVVGLNTSVYYLGIALAAGLVPWMIRHWGRWGLAAGMIASGLSAMLFPWGGGLAGWFVLRALNGVGGAMSLIPLETLVNHTSPPERRSRNFGFYAVAVAVGMALGTWLGMELDASSPRLAFLVGGGVTLVGTVVLVWLPEYRGLAEPRHGRTPLGFVRNFFSFGSAWSQGFLEGGMVSQLPIYLLALGFAENAVGQLLGGLMVGVIAAQLPVAWLADQLGRTQVLFGCYGMV